MVVGMVLKLSFSKHAKAKVKERQIAEETLITVLENPQARFYDAGSWAEVAVGEVSQQGIGFSFVVVFRRRDGICHIVTVYPVKDMRNEVERKVKIGRWVPI
jgi:hypothetical protein